MFNKRIEIVPVTFSVSAAVPAPQQKIFEANLCIFSQFLSATIGPSVALVSAPKITPSFKKTQKIHIISRKDVQWKMHMLLKSMRCILIKCIAHDMDNGYTITRLFGIHCHEPEKDRAQLE
jgi:hypothetical protein